MKKNILSIILIAFFAVYITACDDSTGPDLSDPDLDEITTITGETTELVGPMRGTLLAGRTYVMKGDVIIPPDEEIIVEPGVTIIAEGNGDEFGPEFTVQGSIIAIGTAEQPILFTVPENLRTYENRFAGLWGGFQGSEETKAMVFKHVRMEFLGGEGGPGTPRAGRIRYGIWTLSDQTEVILEDSWIYGSKDDFFRPVGGKLNIVRNVFEFCGEDGGDIINVKGGTVGNIAYNLVIGAATNAFKPSDDGASTIQSNIYVYNNTILNSGFRRAGTGRGSNINFENGARGRAHNNILVNNKNGIRILEDADRSNIDYDYNLFYATFEEFANQFIPEDSATEAQPNSIMGGVGENNPMFVSYNPDQFDLEAYHAAENQPVEMNIVSPHNFRLQANSPAIGAGTTDFSPLPVSFTLTGERAPSILPPSVDMGAYPSDGSGLQIF